MPYRLTDCTLMYECYHLANIDPQMGEACVDLFFALASQNKIFFKELNRIILYYYDTISEHIGDGTSVVCKFVALFLFAPAAEEGPAGGSTLPSAQRQHSV